MISGCMDVFFHKKVNNMEKLRSELYELKQDLLYIPVVFGYPKKQRINTNTANTDLEYEEGVPSEPVDWLVWFVFFIAMLAITLLITQFILYRYEYSYLYK
jgi:hypothetical protein